ncbi:protein kinase, partial [Acidobacteriota bacterium]
MSPGAQVRHIRANQKLGKYRIERKLDEGGFSSVYQALDTIEGIRVALKIPDDRLMSKEVRDEVLREVRMIARLDHPNILPLKNAEFIEDYFVMAFPLGERTLAERLQSRMSLATALDFVEQMLEASAYAHEHRIIHCDIKPENLILFQDGLLMLSDFGIAKVALKTVRASGSGTVGYVAPEQALGKPSFRSDVFSLGLILYRMLTGQLPEWPYEWPLPGQVRLRRHHPDFVKLIRRAIALDPRKRFKNAGRMLVALRRIKPRVQAYRKTMMETKGKVKHRDWRTVQRRQFMREFGKRIEANHTCRKCAGSVSEAMQFCPWCGAERRKHRGDSSYPQQCPRCNRGLKLDWLYCPWCFGPGFDVATNREFSDKRYAGRCSNTKCTRKSLMPFMRYCPWC